MKRILPFLIVLLAFACLLCACDDGGDPGVGTGPQSTCAHSWRFVMDPFENSEGMISCLNCKQGESFPALSDSRLSVSEENDETVYTYTLADGSSIAYRQAHFVFAPCEGGYCLSAYKGSKASVVIPATHNGQPVVAVGNEGELPVFDSAAITSITVPDSVTKIYNRLFSENCTALTKLSLPALENVFLSSLYSTQNVPLTEVTLTSGTAIPYAFFSYCENLETVYLPATVISIGYNAFDMCEALEEVYFNGTLAEYCRIAFDDSWGSSSHPLDNADTLYFKDENGEYVTGSGTLVIPEGVTAINPKAFMRMPLETLVLPDSVITIGDKAFQLCPNLTTVILGSGLESVGKDGFYESTALETVYYKGTASSWGPIHIDNSDGPSNYFLFEAEKFYYSEEGDLFAFAAGEKLWHFDENGMPVFWSFNITDTVDGKTYVHGGTEVEISDEYWYMLESAEAQGMLEYVLEGEQLFFYQNSETKEEFEEKVQTAMNEDYTAFSVSFAGGNVVGISPYPTEYVEVDGEKIYNGITEELLFTIENGKLLFDNSNEYITVITTLTLSE